MKDPHREQRRFWAQVRQGDDGHWVWTGATRANGYGSFAVKPPGGRWTTMSAARWAYTDVVGPIPDGYEVDHLCRTRNCVRPDHLEAVTLAENRRRRDVQYAPTVDTNARPLPVVPPLPAAPPKRDPKTHCINGHAYAEVGWVKNGSRRTCARCRAISWAARNGQRGPAHGSETHCPHGHPYDEVNTYTRRRPNGATQRECRTCTLQRNRAAYKKRIKLRTGQ